MAASEWSDLKVSYALGDFKMPCCLRPAIPKTSSGGLHFFAHQDHECATNPETKWHREGKALIVAAIGSLGHSCDEEVSGGSKGDSWRADTYFELEGRKIVIELQRSYQHLNTFLRRQDRYVRAGIESYWLIRPQISLAVWRALGRLRLARDFGGTFPESGFFPHIKELPVLELETGDIPVVRGAGMFEEKVQPWLLAIIEKRFRWEDGVWSIVSYFPVQNRRPGGP